MREQITRKPRAHFAWASLMLLLLLLLSAGAGLYQQQRNRATVEARLTALSGQAAVSMQRRFELYQYGLRGARGAVITSGRGNGDISRSEFARYAESRDIDTEFPGARGFGYIARVPEAEEASFVARARADGMPDFHVSELAPHQGERFIVKYIEPVGPNRAALGLDIASEQNRRQAAVSAMTSGEATLTGPITLAQASGIANRSMLILMPVYRGSQHLAPKDRVENCIGWVYAPLTTDAILTSIDEANSEYGFRLSDVTDPAHVQVFFTSRQQDARGHLARATRFSLYGRIWEVEIEARPAFLASLALPDPWLVAGLGAGVSMLLSALLAVLLALRARRQRALAQQARMAAIVESSYDAVIGTTIDGRITEWNPAATQIFGYPAATALGMSLADLIVPRRHLSEHRQLMETIAAGGEVAAFETWRRHESGRPLEVEVSAVPIRGERKRVRGVALTVRDIQGRKAAQRRVLELNATLEQQVHERTAELEAFSSLQQAILSNAGYAIIACDPQGTITLFNPAAEAMLGYKSENMVGIATPALFHDPEEIAARAAWLREELGRPIKVGFEVLIAKAKDQPDVNEWTYLTRNGTRVPVLLNVSTLYRGEGEVIGYLGIAVDLRERKKREAALAINERKLRGLFELSPLGIALTDSNGRFVEFNEAFRQLTGYDDDALRQLDYWKLTPKDYEAKEQALQRIIEQTGRYGPFEKEYLRADGERVPVRLNGVRLYMDDKPYLWSIVEDITLQRMTESAMVDAVAAAETASAAKSNFLANMSHEIRTPMNAILGMLQLLRRTGLDSRQEDYRGKTESAARTLLAILNDILDFSKIEAGRQTLETTTFDVESLFRDIGVILGGTVGDKDIELIFNLDRRLPGLLVGDALRLRQVLINLAGNAVKFTSEGEVAITVRVVDRNAQSLRVCFEISDTGIGIDADKLDTIFEGFSQAEASTTRRYGGTGLGLAISKRLVALMGGNLDVDSEPGRGSCFHFTIELGLPTENWAMPATLVAPPVTSLRVLVVDDNASARKVLAEIGSSLGWQVDTVEDGPQALQQLTRSLALAQPYEVVLVDWAMPGIDGWETSKRIRALPNKRMPVIVMVTAHGREALAERSTGDNALLDGFLAKPVTASMLLDAVADARANHPSRRSTSPPTDSRPVQRLQKMHVLVVEDNPTNQQVVTELLQSEGAVGAVAGGGQAALGRLSHGEASFDAVLMDVQMPDMDGYTATRRIRALPGMQHLPIIAMTANVLPSDRQACLDAGMSDHIGKPFDLDDLVGRLRQWTGRSAALARASSHMGDRLPDAPAAVLDSASAIRRMRGNTELYASLLDDFGTAADTLVRGLMQAHQQGDRDHALRQLHTLKGLAGTIGAMALAGLAAAQELAVRSARDDWHVFLEPAKLAEQLAAVQALAATTVPAGRADDEHDTPTPLTQEQLATFVHLLDASNLEALDVYDAIASSMAHVHPETHQRIEAALANMDFAAAHAACQRLIASHDS